MTETLNCLSITLEQAPRRAHEGQSLLVLLVAGLLAHEHDSCMRVAGAEPVWVALAHSGQSWQDLASSRSSFRDFAIDR
jgi:hypothetical protein